MTVSDRIVEEVIAFVTDKVLNDSSLKDRIDELVRESQTASSSKVQNDPADWVFNFLQVEGKPQPTDEIVDAMRDAGIPVSVENPIKTLSERLRRDNRLEYVPDEGWAIKTPYADGPYADGAGEEISDETADRNARLRRGNRLEYVPEEGWAIKTPYADGAGEEISDETADRNARLRRGNRLEYVPEEGWAIKTPYADGAGEEISDETADRFVKNFVENLDAANIGALNHHISMRGVGLPYFVDLKMLREFRSTYKRYATETEKQLLRNSILKEMARD